LETNYSQNKSYYIKEGQAPVSAENWYLYPTKNGSIIFPGVSGEELLTGSNGELFYAGTNVMPYQWYIYPTESGKIDFVDASGISTLQAIAGNLFFNGQLLAKAGDIQNIAAWADYPAIANIQTNFKDIVDVSNIYVANTVHTENVDATNVGCTLLSASTVEAIVETNTATLNVGPLALGGQTIETRIAGGNITTTGDISGATLHISGAAAVGSLSSVGDISGSTIHVGSVAATGDISGATIHVGSATVTGDISGATIHVGSATVTGDISGATLHVGSVAATGDISGATIHVGSATVTGDISGATIHTNNIDLSGCALTSNAGGTALFINGVQVQTGTPADVSQWSTFPAVSDVSMNGKNILGNGPLTISADTLTLSAGTSLSLTRNATTKGIDMTGVITQNFAGSGGNYFQSGTQIGSNGVLPTDNLGTLAVYGGNVPTGLSSLYVKGGSTLDGTLTHGHTIGCLPAAGINTQRIDVLPVGILLTTPTFITMNGAGAANISMGGAIAIAAGSYVTLEHGAGLGSNGIFVQNSSRDANAKMIFAFGGTISGVSDVSSSAIHTALLRTSETAIKLGFNAGTDASGGSVSIGNAPGLEQGGNSIAIGTAAGSLQGANCIAIGRLANAVPSSPYNNTIVLNATGANLKAIADNSTYIAPLRATSTQPAGTAFAMGYTSATSEVTASTTKITDIENTISNTQQISYDTGLLTTTIAGITQLQTVKAAGPVTIGIPAALSTLNVAGTIAIQDASGNTATQVVAQPAFVYYVATNGRVGATGAITDPLKYINDALAKAAGVGGGRPGMTIYLAPGAYTEDVVINISATLPAVSIQGMGDDDRDSKRVQLTGSVTINGTDPGFTNTIDTVVLNNLALFSKDTTTSAVTITGAGIRVYLKNGLYTNQTVATAPLISLSSTGVLPSTVAQLIIDDCSLSMDSATASGHLISMTSGQIFSIVGNSDLTHKGTGSAIFMTGGAFSSANNSAFNSNGNVMTLTSPVASVTTLTNCLVTGKASPTVALITCGTNSNLNLTDCTIQNTNTTEANSTSRYVYLTAGVLVASIRNNYSSSASPAITLMQPYQSTAPASSILFYFSNIYTNASNTVRVTLPAWAAVQQLSNDITPPTTVVRATSGTAITLTAANRGNTYVLTGNTPQAITQSGLGAADAGYFVNLKNGNSVVSVGNVTITGPTGNLTLFNPTTTTNGGALVLYWTGAAFVAY
jgi:hypothetical protein